MILQASHFATGRFMATAVQTSQKVLVYDGDCPMCTATVGWLLGAGWVKPEQARANFDLGADDLELVRAAGIKNQLVVFDPETRETRSGSDGLLWIIGENTRHPLLVRVLGLPGVRRLVRMGYETISYNRRVISPPRHRIVCDCEPEVTLGRRLMLIVPLVVVVLAIVALLGATVWHASALGSAWEGAAVIVATATSGYLALAIVAAIGLGGEQRIDYLAHLAVTMFIGALLVSPAIVVSLVAPANLAMVFDMLAIVAAWLAMFRMQRRRVAAVKLGPGWLAAWAALSVASFAGAVYVIASQGVLAS